MTDGANGCMAICIGDSVVACVMLCYKSKSFIINFYCLLFVKPLYKGHVVSYRGRKVRVGIIV